MQSADLSAAASGDVPEGLAPATRTPGIVNPLSPLVTFLVVAGTTVFTFLQLRPTLIFSSSIDVGGDNAAHIAAVSYLIHDLLPHGHLSGWDPEWFGGFPLYVFYFPLPAVIVAGLYPIFGFAVAFKIVTILGTLLLPVSAYLFGRCAGFARPLPALMSVTMLGVLFNTSYTIDGGNLASTLAGEFSFSLAMAFGLVFLGLLSFALRTGRLRWLAAVLYAATVLSHVVPGIVVTLAAVVMLLTHGISWRSAKITIAIGGVGALLAGFWLLRFKADLFYSSSMGYDKVTDPLGAAGLLPHSGELVVQVLALLGGVIAVVVIDKVALVLVAIALGSAAAFISLPSGLVYNGRWLPFWFLATALLAAYALNEIAKFVLHALPWPSINEWLTPLVVGVTALGIVGGYLGILPGQSDVAPASLVPGWTTFNYTGYQGRQGWPEFERIIAMLDSVGAKYGCGNLDYEYTPNVSSYFGSTIVEMSFPYWTNGCIDSAEGLYYESSTSTPFHFLDQAEVSLQPSNPNPTLPYGPFNLTDGIHHLQLTGVRYFLANSPTVEQDAANDPDLTALASTPAVPTEVDGVATGAVGPSNPRWVVYRINDSPLVEPLRYDPVVEPGMSKSLWLQTAISWYQRPAAWSERIATSGPASWPRATPGAVPTVPTRAPLPPVTVHNVVEGAGTISFSVSRTGVPIVVKVPFFPNWQAHGATGPFLVTPNAMVVVPTSQTVTLVYGTTTVDWLGRIASAFGVAGVVALWSPVAPAPPSPTPALPAGVPFGRLPAPISPRELWWREDEGDGERRDARANSDPDGVDDDGEMFQRAGGPSTSTPIDWWTVVPVTQRRDDPPGAESPGSSE